jgi:hypothetical protein
LFLFIFEANFYACFPGRRSGITKRLSGPAEKARQVGARNNGVSAGSSARGSQVWRFWELFFSTFFFAPLNNNNSKPWFT